MAHLDDGFHSGLASRTLGHHQDTDRLDGAVLGLARPECPSADDGPCRFDGIEGIGLAMAAPGLTVRPVHFDDLDALATEEPGQPHAIGPGAFDADLVHLAEALEPGQQRLVAGGIGIEGLGADESAQRIECGDDVDVQMGVDTTRDADGSFYDGHGHPFLP